MAVEVLESEFTQVPVKEGVKEDAFVKDKENDTLNLGSEPIQFGSNGTEGPVKGEGDTVVANASFPKDAVEDWPAPKQIHSFYFVKVRPYEDPKLKVKLDSADKDLQRKNQERFKLVEAIKAKKSEKANIISQLKPLVSEDKQYKMVVDEKMKEIQPLHQALGKLRERGVNICSSEEELNSFIQSLHYRIQHESNTLVEEKQLLREIKQLEGTRDKVIANAAMKAKIQESLGPKEDIQDQVKLIGLDLDGVRKEKQGIRGKIKVLEDELKIVNSEIESLEEEVTAATKKRDQAYNGILELRKQREEMNASFNKNRSLLNTAREIAAKKDVASLEKLCQSEVENFMSLWSSDKNFRGDYEKRILVSLDMRQLSRDGRMRNPDEKPLVAVAPAPAEPEIVVKSSSKPSVQKEVAPVRKVAKEDKIKAEDDKEIGTKASESEDKENIIALENPKKEPSAADIAKLKEMKREEEISKAKMASERKKKLAEKAASKAAVWAQKEAEKKLKEREKKAKKKAQASAPATNPEEQSEADTQTVEPENTDVSVEAPISSKTTRTTERKDSTIKYRPRTKGPDSHPKAVLKRKKATPYWVWAAPAAVIFSMLLILGYYYIF